MLPEAPFSDDFSLEGTSAAAEATGVADALARRLALQFDVTQILAQSRNLGEVIPRLVEAICRTMQFEVGVFWSVALQANVLRCESFWHEPSRPCPFFEAESWSTAFPPGIGLPGRVWSSGEPEWIVDLKADTNFPRAPVANREGLKSGFGFPVRVGTEVFGILEFFCRRRRDVDDRLMQTTADIGNQVGDFLRRTSGQEAFRETEARYAAILELAQEAIVTIDPEGRVHDFNVAAERLFRARAADVVGHDALSLLMPEGMIERARTLLAQHAKSKPSGPLYERFELQARRVDGSRFPAEVTLARILTSGPALFTAFVRDLSSGTGPFGVETLEPEPVSYVGSSRVSALDPIIAELVAPLELVIPDGSACVWLIDPDRRTLMPVVKGRAANLHLSRVALPSEPASPSLMAELDRARCTQCRRGLHDLAVVALIPGLRASGARLTCAEPLLAPDGKLLGVVAVVVDASQSAPLAPEQAKVFHATAKLVAFSVRQWESAERVRQTHQRFRLAVEGARNHAICLFDDAGKVTSWGAGAENLTGFRASDVVGQPLAWLYATNGAINRQAQRDLEEAAARSSLDADRYFRRRNSDAFLGQMELSALRDVEGHVSGYSATIRDITERRRMERNLALLAEGSVLVSPMREEEATLRRLARFVVPRLADWSVAHLWQGEGLRFLGAVDVDPTQRVLITQLDHQARMASGVHPPQVVAQTGQPLLWSRLENGALAQLDAPRAMLELLARTHTHSLMSIPLCARGQTIAVLTLGLTRSTRSYDETDLSLAEDLARRATLSIENALLFHEARQAIRVRDEFLSIASHELKTPLTSLQLQVDLLQREHAGKGRAGHEGPPRLRRVKREVARMATLIDQLLDISRLTAGRLSLDWERVDLAELTREVVARWSDDMRRYGCSVSLAAPERLAGVWDRSRLEQVLTNLLSNAMKYGQGQPIDVLVRPDGGFARLEVRDRGIGVRPEDHRRIFERFERAASQRNYGGFGLGLWIVRRVVEAMGGSITLESQPGHGSTFIVRLPMRPATGEDAEPENERDLTPRTRSSTH
jgi:PAS domain S-box-containing protein